MTSVMVLMAEWFDVIRWLGALYLVLLGARQLWAWWRAAACHATRNGADACLRAPRRAGPICRAWWSPCPIRRCCCFSAPSSRSSSIPDAAPGPQLAVLAVLFVVVLAAVDSRYTVAVARARATVDMRPPARSTALSGVLLVAGGVVLATARRPLTALPTASALRGPRKPLSSLRT